MRVEGSPRLPAETASARIRQGSPPAAVGRARVVEVAKLFTSTGPDARRGELERISVRSELEFALGCLLAVVADASLASEVGVPIPLLHGAIADIRARLAELG